MLIRFSWSWSLATVMLLVASAEAGTLSLTNFKPFDPDPASGVGSAKPVGRDDQGDIVLQVQNLSGDYQVGFFNPAANIYSLVPVTDGGPNVAVGAFSGGAVGRIGSAPAKWSTDGSVSFLSLPPNATSAWLTASSAIGFTGVAIESGNARPVFWNATGQPTYLDGSGNANAISGDGLIVAGYSAGRATVWNTQSGVSRFLLPTGGYSNALAISSNGGLAAGQVLDNGQFHPIILNLNSDTFQILANQGHMTYGKILSIDSGWLFGATNDTAGNLAATIWTPTGEVFPLNEFPGLDIHWHLLSAISGEVGADGNTVTLIVDATNEVGQERAAELTLSYTLPEPSSFVLGAMGAVVLFIARQRSRRRLKMPQ